MDTAILMTHRSSQKYVLHVGSPRMWQQQCADLSQGILLLIQNSKTSLPLETQFSVAIDNSHKISKQNRIHTILPQLTQLILRKLETSVFFWNQTKNTYAQTYVLSSGNYKKRKNSSGDTKRSFKIEDNSFLFLVTLFTLQHLTSLASLY